MAEVIQDSSKNPSPPTLGEIVGTRVLIAIKRVDAGGTVQSYEQMAGSFERMDDVIHIRLDGSGSDFTLPPDLNSFFRARPGVYTLRPSGEQVKDPAFVSSWTVTAPRER